MECRKQILQYFEEINASFLHSYGVQGTTQLIEKMALKDNERILEVGYGTGATLVKMKMNRPGIELHGVEQVEGMYLKARSRLRACGLSSRVNLNWYGNFQRWEFEDGYFDKIYAESVLGIQDEESLEHVVAEIHRLLKPGGSLFLNETVWLPEISREEIELINNKCKEAFGIIQSSDRYRSVDEWKSMLGQKGFMNLHHELIFSGTKGPNHLEINQPEIASRVFTIRGKLKGIFNRRLRKEIREYREKMRTVFNNKKYMDGYLITGKKISS